MATYHLAVNIISRGRGQSAVASAAYRSGDALYSNEDMETKSYGKRSVKPETMILAPEHAPVWVYNREKLWNEVEAVEKNWNSRFAREVRVALPIELDHDEQNELVKEFVNDNFVNHGMVADISIHRDVEHNPHAHIMLTVRPFNENGTWGNKKKKQYIFDDQGNKLLDKNGKPKYKTISLTEWDSNESLLSWRENWASIVNEYYIQNEIDQTVSHESYEKQNVSQIPKHRLTRSEYKFERRLQEQAVSEKKEYRPKTTYGKFNAEIEKQNQLLKFKQQEIVDIQELRNVVETEMVKELREIRNENKALLSHTDWKSLIIIGKRIRNYVDYSGAKNNLERLSYWKRKLDQEKRMIDAKKDVFETSLAIYEKEPKKVLLYGFIPSQFEVKHKVMKDELNQELSQYEKTLRSYNELHEQSTRALNVEKSFVIKEFAYLYPNYHKEIENTKSGLDIKAKYVELFKSEGQIRSNIPELDSNLAKYTFDHERLSNLLGDWNETNKSLYILNKTKVKTLNEHKMIFNSYDSGKAYTVSVKYSSVVQQIEDKELQKDKVASGMYNEMFKRYPGTDDGVIKEIPARLQYKLLSLHLEGANTGSLADDLGVIRDEELQQHENSPANESQVGGLFASLINSAIQGDGKKDGLEKQRRQNKKARRRKLYKDLDENEL